MLGPTASGEMRLALLFAAAFSDCLEVSMLLSGTCLSFHSVLLGAVSTHLDVSSFFFFSLLSYILSSCFTVLLVLYHLQGITLSADDTIGPHRHSGPDRRSVII